MADQKVSQLPVLTSPASEDLLLIIDNPNVTPASKHITLKILFGNVPANTSISARLSVSGNTSFTGANNQFTSVKVNNNLETNKLKVSSNGLIITTALTPASSGITISQGKFFWDSNYLYVATANNTIKRVALSSF